MAKLGTYDEVEAIKLLIEGDEKGFRMIYDRYALNILRLGRRYLGSVELANDLSQEVFGALWRQRETLAEVENFPKYFFSMVKWMAYRQLNKIANRELGEGEYVSMKSFEENHSTESILRDQECEQLFYKLVERLPENHRKVYKLVMHEGLSHRAVAEQLNLTEKTVSNSMTLAIKSLKHQLGHYTIMVLSLIPHFLQK
jgi:RNA polymerase sigma-70 factor (family 1)